MILSRLDMTSRWFYLFSISFLLTAYRTWPPKRDLLSLLFYNRLLPRLFRVSLQKDSENPYCVKKLLINNNFSSRILLQNNN